MADVADTTPIYLNYIGFKAYPTDELFLAEAKKINAQRACPLRVLRQIFASNAEIYYARYEDNVAKVFAKGKVIGVASTSKILQEKLKEMGDNQRRVIKQSRGCGDYYCASAIMKDDKILEIIDEAIERGDRGKWFIKTDIDSFNSVIQYVIEYKPKSKQMIVKPIEFTRGFIKVYGGYNEVKARMNLEISSMLVYRPRNKAIEVEKPKPKPKPKYQALDVFIKGKEG